MTSLDSNNNILGHELVTPRGTLELAADQTTPLNGTLTTETDTGSEVQRYVAGVMTIERTTVDESGTNFTDIRDKNERLLGRLVDDGDSVTRYDANDMYISNTVELTGGRGYTKTLKIADSSGNVTYDRYAAEGDRWRVETSETLESEPFKIRYEPR